jgi:exonuclease SbcD
MRFLHTSDLHLGRRLGGFEIYDLQKDMLDQLFDKAVQTRSDAVVISGDVFDSQNSPAQATRMWDGFMTRMSDAGIPLIAVSGNHDLGARLGCGSGILAKDGVHICGELLAGNDLTSVVVGGVRFWLIPFVHPSDVRSWASWRVTSQSDESLVDESSVESDDVAPSESADGFAPDDISGENADAALSSEPAWHAIRDYTDALRFLLDQARADERFPEMPNVCIAHQFVTAGGIMPERSDSERLTIGTLDNVDASVFEGFSYVALGHIHKPQYVAGSAPAVGSLAATPAHAAPAAVPESHAPSSVPAPSAPVIRYSGTPLAYSSSEAGQPKSFSIVDIDESGRVSVTQEPVVPLRAYRIVTGTLEELRQKWLGESDEQHRDYVCAVLTQDEMFDVREQIQSWWPNTVEIRFDNSISRAGGVDLSLDRTEEEDLPALFARFFEGQAGEELSDEERAIVESAMQRAMNAGGDE